MTVKRIVGATARDCLRQVKEALGPDAVVISNRTVAGGVEIVAMSPESLDAISQQVQPTEKTDGKPSLTTHQAVLPSAGLPPHQSTPLDDDYTVTLSAARRDSRREPLPVVRAWSPFGGVPAQVTPMPGQDASAFKHAANPIPPAAASVAAAYGAPAADVNPASSLDEPVAPPSGQAKMKDEPLQAVELMEEMRAIKSLLERQLAGFAWGEMARENPLRAQLLSEMLAAGFSGELARRLVQEMPVDLGQDEARKWLTAAVNRRLRTLSSEADFIDRGGVYALVGPTGVGKTTTTAKLAARCVVRHGPERLALITTDSYRIGAHEQLRIYGRILGVPVFVVRDSEDLQRTLADLRDKHMVLIDTVGMSQRDRLVTEQAAMLTRSGEVNRLLLLNAGSRGDTLDDVVRAYGGDDLAGCILTKVDEATALAPSIDCIVRHGLTLSYVANGQRVPEDIYLPNRKYLLHRAFKVGAGDTAHTLRKEEIALGLVPHQDIKQMLAQGASFA